MNPDLSTIPVGVLVALGVLAVVQITLDVIALVDLYRRPVERVVLGNKWIWVAIILLVNTLGAIIYLVAGRKPAALTENATPPASPSIHTEDIANTLYGPRDGTDRR
jgi:NADH:ubiquinone oxidoreductase subunit 6 (subunit J)